MKKIELLLIFLFIATVIAALLSLRYIVPPDASVKECLKIDYDSEKEDCITAVAGIKQDSSICRFLSSGYWTHSNPMGDCKENIDKWSSKYGLSIPPMTSTYTSSLDTTECVDSGLVQNQYYFLELPHEDYRAGYYEFAPGCKEKLEKLNESYCLPQGCSFFESNVEILSHKLNQSKSCTANLSNIAELSYCNYGDLPITVTFRICKSSGCAKYPKEVTIPANECIYEEVCDSYESVYVTDVQWPSIVGCDIDSLDKYDLSSCIMNIGIAKGRGAAKTCENQNIIDSDRDSCYMKYAHVHNDKTACSLIHYDSEDCYYGYAIINGDESSCSLLDDCYYYYCPKDDCLLYFALKKRDAVLCSDISNSDTMHLCKAIIFAQTEQ